MHTPMTQSDKSPRSVRNDGSSKQKGKRMPFEKPTLTRMGRAEAITAGSLDLELDNEVA
jgi:hypothetical protein